MGTAPACAETTCGHDPANPRPVQVVAKLAGQTTFVVLPRRWCVERTFSWINRCRRTVRDYERLPAHHAAFVYWSMIIIMGRRLARHHAAGRLIPQPTRVP